MIYVLLGVRGQVLRTWLDGPNRVRWIFGRRRKIAKGLAILEPFGLFREGCVWPIRKGVLIRFNEEIVAFFAKILHRLSRYEFFVFGC
jgi:hypothetical protein